MTDLSRSDSQRFKKSCILDEIDERQDEEDGKIGSVCEECV
jgi:hypothetical protein